RRHNKIYRNVYLAKKVEPTPERRAVAAWLWSGRNATIAGMSAAALHGSEWIAPDLPAELTRRRNRLETAIIRVDALANATGLKPEDLDRLRTGIAGPAAWCSRDGSPR
ncbi:MAG TPA: hypothetical protein VFK56_12225, partial [Mycobacterium sp.]|nr:hypothetical protein [Mycobacterium sp.]